MYTIWVCSAAFLLLIVPLCTRSGGAVELLMVARVVALGIGRLGLLVE